MKKSKKIILTVLLVILALVIALGVYVLKVYGPNFGIYLFKPSVVSYVEQATEFMEQGIYADSDLWREKKAEMLKEAEGKSSYEECYDLIESGLKVAGGKHSAILKSSDETSEIQNVSVSKDANNILTIKIPGFMDGTSKDIELFVQTAHSWLSENKDCRGVIIDLRGNRGGDSGPMLAAVAPLLPNGTLLSFDESGVKQDVVLSDDTVTGSGSTVSFEPFKLTGIPVAILQDGFTASSGEVVLLSFRGLDYAKTFGDPSAGYASCNTVRKLYDGTRLMITIGRDVARTGEVFCEDPVCPDVLSSNPEQDAVSWILSYGK